MFDVGQIEVLKGPQALFYGKSSPGGVISLRTADPTDTVELIARVGHEFEANENRGELIVSGPVADSLKLRLAAMYTKQDGFFDNEATALPGTGALAPGTHDFTPSKNYIVRATALWNPTEALTVRFKGNYTNDDIQWAGAGQATSCPEGVTAPIGVPPFMNPNEDCRLNGVVYAVGMDPTAFPGVRNGGVPFMYRTQRFGTLELNYDLPDHLTLTSASGYYSLTSDTLANAAQSGYAGGPLAVDNHFRRHDFTEEVRLNSDFSGPVNFTLGGFYQDGSFNNFITLYGDTAIKLPSRLAVGDKRLRDRDRACFPE